MAKPVEVETGHRLVEIRVGKFDHGDLELGLANLSTRVILDHRAKLVEVEGLLRRCVLESPTYELRRMLDAIAVRAIDCPTEYRHTENQERDRK